MNPSPSTLVSRALGIVIFAVAGLALTTTACSSAPDPAGETAPSVDVNASTTSPSSVSLGRRVMKLYGWSLSALEQIECGKLNGVSETFVVDGCTIRVTNTDCRTEYSSTYGEYVCTCERMATPVSGSC